MRLIPAATAAWIAVWCSRTHLGVLLDRDEQQRLHVGPGEWDPVPVSMSAEAVVGPKVLAALLAWVM